MRTRSTTTFRDDYCNFRRAPKGTRRAGTVALGEWIPRASFLEIRVSVRKAAKYWGGCYLLMFPDGGLLLRKEPPKETKYLVAYYKYARSSEIRADIHQGMMELGYPEPVRPRPGKR